MTTSRHHDPHPRRQYPSLMRMQQAKELCRAFSVGAYVFRKWCQSCPVPGMVFREKLPGYKTYHYRRDTILACIKNSFLDQQHQEQNHQS